MPLRKCDERYPAKPDGDAGPGPTSARPCISVRLRKFLFHYEEERHLIMAAKLPSARQVPEPSTQMQPIAQMTKEVKLTPAALADKLIKILKTYPLDSPPLNRKTGAIQCAHRHRAQIILSESFR